MESIFNELTSSYTEGKSLVDDSVFDELTEIVNLGNSDLLRGKVGDFGVIEKGKVPLPKQMMSMDKLKDEKAFNKWKPEGILNVSSKLDGISLLIVEDKAYRRGDSKNGQDVTWLKNLMNIPSTYKDVMVRGELIVSKKNWEILKLKNIATNPLSFVAGYANSKTPDPILANYLNFVAFQFIDDKVVEKSPSVQFDMLEKHGYKIVQNKNYTGLEWGALQNILDQYRDTSDYVLDGIILTEDRNHQRVDYENPPHSKAFKDSIIIESEVKRVVWEISRYGTIKPVVIFDERYVEGKTYKQATGHNAAFIRDNKIGPGSIVTIGIKIIPSILSVIQEADYPDFPRIPFKWRNLEIIDDSGEESVIKRAKIVENFIISLGVDGFKQKSIEKVFSKGYETIGDILRMTREEFKIALGLNGLKIYDKLNKKYNEATDEDLFLASGLFEGLGRKQTTALFDAVNLTNMLLGNFPEKIVGFGPKRMETIKEGIPKLFEWMITLPPRKNIREREEVESGENKTKVILTGDPPDGFSKKKFLSAYLELFETTKWSEVELLLTNSEDSSSNKIEKARIKNIPIMTYRQYMDSQK